MVPSRLRLPLSLGALACLGACGLGSKSGLQPPLDRIFFPTGLAADGSGGWLYVVNSNSDLRYNAGTLIAVDLGKTRASRSEAASKQWESCPLPGNTPRLPPAGTPFCCLDALDRRILDCDERAYVDARATVRLGSFGGAVIRHPYQSGGEPVDRLYLAVRADPSVTVVDARVRDGRPTFRCSGPRNGEPGGDPPGGNPTCSDEWKVRSAVHDPGITVPEEPYALALDPGLGVLYVGHLLGGQISVLDVCDPRDALLPRLVGVHDGLLRPDGNGRRGITSLVIGAPGNPDGRTWATSRYSATVASFVLRGARAGECSPGEAAPGASRDLAIVGAGSFTSTAFAPGGADLRGFVIDPDRERAYVLHRFPSSVEFVDLRPDGYGNPAYRAVAVVEVCAGAQSLRMHDAGRGPMLFVNCFEGGQIHVVDPDRAQLIAGIEAGRGPAGLVFDLNDRQVAYVAGFSDNNVSVVDLRPGSPTEFRVVQRLGFPSAVPR